MSNTIFFLVKIFKTEGYAEDFIKGKLHANRLSYFRKIEEVENSNRGDEHEGVISCWQPNQSRFEINGRVLTDLAGPVSVKMNWQDNLNIFCIYAAHSGDFEEITEKNLDAFKKQLEIPDECQKLGEHAVFITSFTKFVDRVKSTVKTKNYRLSAGLVEYYDPETFNGSFSEDESVFRKHFRYNHQKEYRFVFDTGLEGTNALNLEIGDISDITMRCKVSKINELLEIKLKRNSDDNQIVVNGNRPQ